MEIDMINIIIVKKIIKIVLVDDFSLNYVSNYLRIVRGEFYTASRLNTKKRKTFIEFEFKFELKRIEPYLLMKFPKSLESIFKFNVCSVNRVGLE